MNGQAVPGHVVSGQVITGHQETKIEPNGNATDSFYDLSGRLTDVWEPAVLDGDPNSPTHGQMVRPHWHYGYDNNGNEVLQVDPKGTTTFTFDDQNRQTSRTLPDGETEFFTYNAFPRTNLNCGH